MPSFLRTPFPSQVWGIKLVLQTVAVISEVKATVVQKNSHRGLGTTSFAFTLSIPSFHTSFSATCFGSGRKFRYGAV